MGVDRCITSSIGTAFEDKQPPLKPLCSPQENQSNEFISLLRMSEIFGHLSSSSSHQYSNSGNGADGEACIYFSFTHFSGSTEMGFNCFGWLIQWPIKATPSSGKTADPEV